MQPVAAAEQVLVPFEGEGSGDAELTWGQIGLWQSIEMSGSKTVPYIAELPPGMTVSMAAERLRFMVSRHQSLRTRLQLRSGGPPRQRCASSGEVPLEIVDAGDRDPAEVAEAVSEYYQEKPFEFETEWPLRMAVIRSGDVLTHMVLVILHTSIDAYGLTALMSDVESPEAALGVPPLEQARKQASPAGQRHNQMSLQYLEKVLHAVTPSRFGEPKYADEGIDQIQYRSPATLLSIDAVAARNGINTSPVLLASFAVGLARFTGVNPVLAMLMVSNRFRPGFANSVSALIQITPYLIDVADVTLDEAVARASHSALNAYKNAYYNPYEQDEVIERVERERGEEIDLSCFYNDRRQQDRGRHGTPPSAEQIREALPRSTFSWTGEINPPKRKLYFNVDDPPGCIEFMLSADRAYFSRDDLLALIREVESVAVSAALDGTTSTNVTAAARV
jgi:Condensation domain